MKCSTFNGRAERAGRADGKHRDGAAVVARRDDEFPRRVDRDVNEAEHFSGLFAERGERAVRADRGRGDAPLRAVGLVSGVKVRARRVDREVRGVVAEIGGAAHFRQGAGHAIEPIAPHVRVVASDVNHRVTRERGCARRAGRAGAGRSSVPDAPPEPTAPPAPAPVEEPAVPPEPLPPVTPEPPTPFAPPVVATPALAPVPPFAPRPPPVAATPLAPETLLDPPFTEPARAPLPLPPLLDLSPLSWSCTPSRRAKRKRSRNGTEDRGVARLGNPSHEGSSSSYTIVASECRVPPGLPRSSQQHSRHFCAPMSDNVGLSPTKRSNIQNLRPSE